MMENYDWLVYEKRLAYVLERWPKVPALDPFPEAAGRDSLLIMASLSVLDESSTGLMPEQAVEEIRRGIGGPVRTAIAQTDDHDDPTLERLSEDLVTTIAGRSGADGAITIFRSTGAWRIASSIVPPIVGLEFMLSFVMEPMEYAAHHDWIPGATSTRDTWLRHPEKRDSLDQQIREFALSMGGKECSDILDRAG